MKTLLLCAGLLAAAVAQAQPTNAPAPPAKQTLDFQIPRAVRETPLVLPEPKVNEITIGKVTYSGMAVLLIRADHPLQLFNPAAPPRYGSFEDSIVREPIHRKVVGVKLFSIGF